MFKGTFMGDIEEIKFVKLFNHSKQDFKYYLNKFKFIDDYLWMVRVTTKQISSLNNKKVFTRSDCYLIYTEENINQILIDNKYLLDEDILKRKEIKHIKVPFSGISIKMTSSDNYQILKIGPNSFKDFFGNFELGAGASLFCKKEIELPKNLELISGWKSSLNEMMNYFQVYINGNNQFYLNKEICTKIKNHSCIQVKKLIDTSSSLSEKIFNGKGLYCEPYTAYYFYHGKKIENLKYINFNITTGSGRSKGEYTIVLKPKKEI